MVTESWFTGSRPSSGRFSKAAAWIVLAFSIALGSADPAHGGDPRDSSVRLSSGVEIRGNRVLTEREIREVMGLGAESGSGLGGLQDALRRLEDEYRSLGYWGAGFKLERDRTSGKPVLWIQEGNRIVVEEVEIKGNRAVPEERLRALMRLRSGRALTAKDLEADIEGILRYYEENGFPFAGVRPTGFTLAGGLRFALDVDEGPRVRIGGVVFEGNETAKSDYLLRQSGFEPGETYSASRMEEARAALENTGLFEALGDFRLVRSPTGRDFDLIVPVVERRVNEFSGALGYGGGPGVISGVVDLLLGNISGRGRKAAVHWFRADETYSRFSLSYLHPWPLGLPVQVSGKLKHEVDEPSYIANSLSLGLGSGLRGRLTRTVSFRVEQTVYGTEGLIRRDKKDVVLDVEWKSMRKPAFRALSGRAYGSAEYGLVREASEDGSRAGRTIEVAAGGVVGIPFGAAWGCALDLRGAMAYDSGGPVKPDELFRLGGASSLRGFREEQFRVERYVLSRTELHYFFAGPSGSGYAFADAAVFQPSRCLGGPAGGQVEGGYGFGISAPSRIGSLRVEVGASARGLSEGVKLHVSVKRRF